MRRYLPKKTFGKTVIGILGMAPGLGVTHLSITLANYLAEMLRVKVAVLECNDHGDLEELLPHSRGGRPEDFRLLGVDYYLNVRPEKTADLMNKGYDYYICDFGFDVSEAVSELYRCDRKLLIGSCAAWRRNEFIRFLNQFEYLSESKEWEILTVDGLQSDKKEVERQIKHGLTFIPFLEDPFRTERENFSFLEHFM